jgi:protease-4
VQKIVIEQRYGSRWGRWLLVLALIVSIALNVSLYGTYHSYFSPDSQAEEKYHSLSKHAADKVAIISLEGVILEGDGFIKSQIDRVREDTGIKAVVLRINSPGGTVTGSDYIYHQLREMLKERQIPLVVSMGGVAASGGYYAAMAVGNQQGVIFAEPSTLCGSIGVMIPHYNFAGLMERFNVQNDSVVSHPLKDLGALTKEMTEEERAILQSLVDDMFEQFKEVVRNGRPVFADNEDKLTKVATGQVFSSGQAVSQGLIDRIGYLEDAVARAIELAKLDKNHVRVIKYESPPDLLDMVVGDVQVSQQRPNWAQLLEAAVSPRGFYLYSGLPPLVIGGRRELAD